MPLVSIVVPVYNVEAYVGKCLRSLQAQTLKDWEAIVVDDGSTDGSSAICRELCAGDSRFKYIRKDNGGLSSARNAALEVAQGDYIGFVDSDDWVEPDMFEKLHKAAVDTEADVVISGWVEERGEGGGGAAAVRRSFGAAQFSCHDALWLLLQDKEIKSYVWNKLIRRDVAAGIRFDEGRIFEDTLTTYKWFLRAKKIVRIGDCLYHYRIRNGGISNSHMIMPRYQAYKASLERYCDIMRLGVLSPQEDDKLRFKMANGYIQVARRLCRSTHDFKRSMDLVAELNALLRSSRVRASDLRLLSHKNRAHWLLLRYSPKLFYLTSVALAPIKKIHR